MYFRQSLSRKEAAFVAFFTIVCISLAYMPTGFEDRLPEHSRFARGRVLSADNSDIHKALIVKTGSQNLNVQLMEGPFEGQTVSVVNQLTGKMEMDEIYVQGRDILVEYSVRDGKLGRAVARGNYRLRLELVLMALFAGLLLAVGGWTGLKALLSFVFAALMLWKVMIPWFLEGKDPVLGALAVVAALTAAVSFLVGGLSKKGLVTFIGAFSGLLLTCALAKVFTGSFRIHGAVRPFAETLVYSGFGHLDLSGIFVAGIFVACSGAVMDLAMDISASMHEIAEKKPEIGFVEHMASGMAIGRSVIGTMTTTLLLAYSGSYIALLMLFMSLGVPLPTILNKNFVAAEVVNTIVGSFGLVTVAPFTALTGGLIYGIGRRKAPDSDLVPKPPAETVGLGS